MLLLDSPDELPDSPDELLDRSLLAEDSTEEDELSELWTELDAALLAADEDAAEEPALDELRLLLDELSPLLLLELLLDELAEDSSEDEALDEPTEDATLLLAALLDAMLEILLLASLDVDESRLLDELLSELDAED